MLTSRRTVLRRSFLSVPMLFADLFSTLQAAAQAPSFCEQWYRYPFHNFTMKATSVDTENSTAWMLIENSPHQGVPLQKHLYEDESFFVISGAFDVQFSTLTNFQMRGFEMNTSSKLSLTAANSTDLSTQSAPRAVDH